MKTYIVGGYVRDLLYSQIHNIPFIPSDRDWVVVGSTEDELLSLGYKRVGKDFPVFLHPETREEYALARTEKKTGPGHKGFEVEFGPDITIEQDLQRRDFTINAIALDPETNQIIDPFYGLSSLFNMTISVCNRNSFNEDPLRILRLARMTAKYPDFRISSSTINFASMALDGLKELSPERVGMETEKAFKEKRPSNYFRFLSNLIGTSLILEQETGTIFVSGLAHWFPALERMMGIPHRHLENVFDHTMMVLDRAPSWATLYHDTGKGLTPKSEWPKHNDHETRSVEIIHQELGKLKLPKSTIQMAANFAADHMKLHRWKELRAHSVIKILEHCHANHFVLEQYIKWIEADEQGIIKVNRTDNDSFNRATFFNRALLRYKSVSGDKFVEKFGPGPKIGDLILEERIKLIKKLQKEKKEE